MRRGWRTILAILLAGCSASGPMTTKQALPVVSFDPSAAYEWPLLPTPDGWLVGGSGYATGYGWPWGVTPGLGIGAVLLPSVTAAHTVMPGILPWPPPPVAGPFPLWVSASDVEAHASDIPTVPVLAMYNVEPSALPTPSGSDSAASDAQASPIPRPSPLVLGPSPYPVRPTWTKMGPTLIPPQVYTEWPKAAFHLSPWGPVVWQPGPLPSNTPLVPLGFPPADGTPVAQAYFLPWVRIIRGTPDVVLWDFVTRTLHRVPSLIPMDGFTFFGVAQRDGLLFVSSRTPSHHCKLVDLLTGGIDPLPELTDNVPEFNGNLSWRGWFIAYTAQNEGRLRVHLFDRRTRTINRLSHLNGPDDCFAPAVDQMARTIAYVTIRNGQRDIRLYDTITGLVDPLPAVNTGVPEFAPFLSDDGRWMVFIRLEDGIGRIRLYDRATGAIDPLPELNTIGDYTAVGITGLSGDGLVINAAVMRHGHRQGVVYLRPSGFIDPIPEVNDTAEDVYF